MTDARRGYASILDEALTLYTPDALAGLKFRVGWTGVGHLAHGRYMRCQRGAQALILLDNGGFSEKLPR